MNLTTMGGNSLYGHLGTSNTQNSAKNDPKYLYYANNSPNDKMWVTPCARNTGVFLTTYTGMFMLLNDAFGGL